ncbi:MAG: amidohydrolase family protein [Gemmatimonadaceae bacterium]|nr:amidohydrolase family protein [Gemmatimonadaceae bacterium]
MRASTAERRVYTAQWVMPIADATIADGAVVVDGTRIAYVGTIRDLPAAFTDDPRTELGNAVLLPGLVNAHTHLELTAMRGFLEGLAFRDWLGVLTRARRECFEPESLYDSSCAGLEEALRNGITTCADTTESGAPLDAMRDLGMRGIGFLEVFGPDPTHQASALSGLMQKAATLRQRDTTLVQTGLSPHAPYTVSAGLFRAVAEYARHEAWPVAVHIAESDAESRFVRDGQGPFADALRARGIAVAPQARSPIALLDACGILACEPLLIHAIRVDDDDIARLADRGARVVHCPISNLKLGHGVAPLAQFRAAGIAVGLGTDSVASNDRMDLLGEARQAALLHSMRSGIPDALSAQDALHLATLGGARALGLADRIGSLEVGKEADLAAFSLAPADARPVHDPAVTLVHVLAGASTATLVVVAGRERVRHGTVIDADSSRHARIEALGARLRAWRTRYLMS